MNPHLRQLHSYPFEKWASLKADIPENTKYSPIALSIGEPKHAPPQFVLDELVAKLGSVASYPLTKGSNDLREAISNWLNRRFKLNAAPIDPQSQVLPVNGTREALFAFAQAMIDPTTPHSAERPLVLAPNPFYQIYEGAAILAGAELLFLNTTRENQFSPNLDDIDEKTWRRCQLIYICSPGNPTGKVLSTEYLEKLLDLADKYDFIIASDECYSEIYFDENNPPPGLLQVAAATGRTSYKNCVVFHSLSKRSNLPGLRSGFVAGDADILKSFLRYRTYHGSAMSLPIQAASVVAWNDEEHVKQNRDLYREKFHAVLEILKPVLDVEAPDAGFYLWAKTPINDQDFAKGLYAEKNITVLPGSFLSRVQNNVNPGENYIRMALVAETKQCVAAAKRIKDFLSA